MKKIDFFLGLVATIALALVSCSSAGDKAVGTYNGSYAIDSTASYPVSGTVVFGNIEVTKVSETAVNMNLICNSPALSDVSTGVSATLNGDVVNFNYSQATTTDQDMITLSGSLSGNTLTIHGTMYRTGAVESGTFTGTK